MRNNAIGSRRDLSALIIAVGFFVALSAHYVLGGYRHVEYPYNTFLFHTWDNAFTGWPEARGFGDHLFSDFFQPWEQTRQPSPYESPNRYFRSNYPPFVHLLLKPLTWLSYQTAVIAYLLCVAAALLIVVAASLPGRGAGRLHAAFSIAFLSYPTLFLIDRGNVDGIALVCALLALAPHRANWPWWARPVFLGAAAATKGYPIAFALLYVRERKWKELGLTVGSCSVLTLIAASIFAGGPVRALAQFADNVGAFSKVTAADNITFVQHTTSLDSAIRALVEMRIAGLSAVQITNVCSVALVVCAVAAVAFLPLRRWEQLFCVCCLFTIFSKSAADYRSTFFLLPLLALISDAGMSSRVGLCSTAIVSLFFVPKSLPIFYADVNAGVIVNPLLLTGIVGVVVAGGLQRRIRATHPPVAAEMKTPDDSKPNFSQN